MEGHTLTELGIALLVLLQLVNTVIAPLVKALVAKVTGNNENQTVTIQMLTNELKGFKSDFVRELNGRYVYKKEEYLPFVERVEKRVEGVAKRTHTHATMIGNLAAMTGHFGKSLAPDDD